jgi:hypothetical protein
MFSPKPFQTVIVTLIACFLLCNGGASAGQGEQDSVQLRSEFEQARQTVSGFKVESFEAFQRMKDYHTRVVNDPAVVHRFETHDGRKILCVDIYSQESVRALGIDPSEIRLSPDNPPQEQKASTTEALSSFDTKLPGSQWLDGSLDSYGQLRTCPENSFPKLAPRLEDLYRYRSLDAYFDKYRRGGEPAEDVQLEGQGPSAAAAAEVHRYAYVDMSQQNGGGGAAFSIWNPSLERNDEFSLSQLWADDQGNATNPAQTVEMGLQKYPFKYGSQNTILFIFYTVNGYTQRGDNLGCYNLECIGFVQTNRFAIPGAPISQTSSIGGTQYDVMLEAFKDPNTGDWWLRYGGTFIGYYPKLLFRPGGMADSAKSFKLGGEIVDVSGSATKTDMGSGRFPSAGWTKAAYIRQIHWWTPQNVYRNDGFSTNLLNASSGGVQLYDISTIFQDPGSYWAKYFYYGGPGSDPEKAILVSPSGTIATTTPTYTWNAVSNSTWYYLWVDDSTGNKINQWYTAAQAGCGGGTGTCSIAPATALAAGSAKWWVQTYSANSYGPWSDAMAFTVSPPDLVGKATLISPSGTIATTTPTYTWNAVSNSTWYYLWVDDSTGNKINQWYTAAQAGCGGGTGTCQVTPSISLAQGSCSWWIRTYGNGGNGPWSNQMDFTVGGQAKHIHYVIDKITGTTSSCHQPRDRSQESTGDLPGLQGTIPISYSETWDTGFANMTGSISISPAEPGQGAQAGQTWVKVDVTASWSDSGLGVDCCRYTGIFFSGCTGADDDKGCFRNGSTSASASCTGPLDSSGIIISVTGKETRIVDLSVVQN